MAPDIPWQVFAWLVTSMMGVGTGIIAWAVWRGNQTAKSEAMAAAIQEQAMVLRTHFDKDEKFQEAIATRLEQVGSILSTIQQRQAVIMDRIGIRGG